MLATTYHPRTHSEIERISDLTKVERENEGPTIRILNSIRSSFGLDDPELLEECSSGSEDVFKSINHH